MPTRGSEKRRHSSRPRPVRRINAAAQQADSSRIREARYFARFLEQDVPLPLLIICRVCKIRSLFFTSGLLRLLRMSGR
jgi:hypothetical protein